MHDAREEDEYSLWKFFQELNLSLEAARKLEHELNRHLAHQFNVFKYLKMDELGLSLVIADLLNPAASHGQGALFLEIFLDQVRAAPEWPDIEELSQARVVVEKAIAVQRRKRFIDIHVKIPSDPTQYCLAIENKPYAHDQKDQVKDYLEYLEKEYRDRFLLVYLTPTGTAPSETSISRQDLADEKWRGHFAIMPYHSDESGGAAGGDAVGENLNPQADARVDSINAVGRNDSSAGEMMDFQAGCSLTSWLSACREQCQVERLRWFLHDAEQFCQKQFGGHAMASDRETAALEKFLFQEGNTDNLKTAQLIHTLWPRISDRICGGFLENLATRIGQNIKKNIKGNTGEIPAELADDVVSGYRHGIGAFKSNLWITLKSWTEYDTGKSSSAVDSHRTCIQMENQSSGPNNWILGISSPMEKSRMKEGSGDKDRRQRLENCLRDNMQFQELRLGESSDWWPSWDYVKREYRDWSGLVPSLSEEYKSYEECKSAAGEITDYFVEEMTRLAMTAIPIINSSEAQ